MASTRHATDDDDVTPVRAAVLELGLQQMEGSVPAEVFHVAMLYPLRETETTRESSFPDVLRLGQRLWVWTLLLLVVAQ